MYCPNEHRSWHLDKITRMPRGIPEAGPLKFHICPICGSPLTEHKTQPTMQALTKTVKRLQKSLQLKKMLQKLLPKNKKVAKDE